MANPTVALRQLSVITLAIVVVVSFGGGAGTYALLTDSESSASEQITLAKKNQGAVSFDGCSKVTVEPDNTSDFTVDVGTNVTVHSFDDIDFNSNKKKFKIDTGDEIPSDEMIRNATLDGTLYQNSNYEC